MLAPRYEFLKGLTDVPLALLAFFFGILLLRKDFRSWAVMFFFVSAAAVFGSIVHMFDIGGTSLKLLWVVLYVFLYESTRRFSCLMIGFLNGTDEKERPAVFIIEMLLYVCTLIWMFSLTSDSIVVLVAFLVIVFMRVAVCFFRQPHPPAEVRRLLILLAVPIILQALDNILPYAVTAEHIALAIAMWYVYRLGLHSSDEEDRIYKAL